MKIRRQSLSVVLCALAFVVRNVSPDKLDHFAIGTDNKCNVTNPDYWSLIQWFYGTIKSVDVNQITQPNSSSCVHHQSDVFLKQLSQRLNFKVSYSVFDTQFEPPIVTFFESFSWDGDKFEQRPRQPNVTITVRRRRHKRDTSSAADSTKSWSRRSNVPEEAAFVVTEKISLIDEYLTGSARHPFEYARRIFIIAVTSASESNFQTITENVLDRLWNVYGIAEVLVITPCDGDPEIIRTYHPFEMRTKGNDIPWGNIQEFNLSDLNFTVRNLFTKFDNLHGFPLRVTIFQRYPTSLKAEELPKAFTSSYLLNDIWRSDGYAGVDGIMMSIAAKSMNFTAVNIPQIGVDFGYQASNGTFVGSIGSVLYSKVFVSFNGRFITDYGTNDVDYMFPYFFDKLCVIAPKAQKVPKWMDIFQCFNKDVWFTLFGMNCLCGCFWFWVKRASYTFLDKQTKKSEKSKSSNEFINVFIEMWLIMLSGSATQLPFFTKERLFLATCLFSSIIFAGTFEGTLTTSYSTVKYYKDINTLKELDDSGLGIGTSSGSLSRFFGENNTGSDLIKSLASKFKILDSKIPTIDRTAYNRDICAIERLTDISVKIVDQYEKADGSQLLHVVKQCPRAYYMSYIVKTGSPLLPTFNKFVSRLFEGGIVDMWYRHVENAIITRERYHRFESSDEARVFSMDDMQTAFYILFIGIGFCSLVFIGELYIHRRKQKQKMIKPFKFVH